MALSLRTRRFAGLMCLIACTTAYSLAAEVAGTGNTPSRRDLTTDRPDATESPFTVNAGLTQLEMSFASYTRDEAEEVRFTQWEIAPFNVRYGVTERFEAGVFIFPRIEATAETADGAKATVRGFGDVLLRGKFNLWGNDGGPTALGIFGDLKLPTAKRGLGNRKVEAAVTLPVAYELGGGWDGAAMTAVELRYTDRDRYEPVWLNTITFAHDLAENLGGFLELTSETGDGGHAATFNCGLTYRIDPETQWDCGANFGISDSAPDLGVFVGLSRRY